MDLGRVPAGVICAKGIPLATRWTLAMYWAAAPPRTSTAHVAISRVSGLDVARSLGVTRGTVAKHLRALTACGVMARPKDVQGRGLVAVHWGGYRDPGEPMVGPVACSCDSSEAHCRCRVLAPFDDAGSPQLLLRPEQQEPEPLEAADARPEQREQTDLDERLAVDGEALPAERAGLDRELDEQLGDVPPAPPRPRTREPAPPAEPSYSLTPPPSSDIAGDVAKLLNVQAQFTTQAQKAHGILTRPLPAPSTSAGKQLRIMVTRAVEIAGRVACMTTLRARFELWQRDPDLAREAPVQVWKELLTPAPSSRGGALGSSGFGSNERWAERRALQHES